MLYRLHIGFQVSGVRFQVSGVRMDMSEISANPPSAENQKTKKAVLTLNTAFINLYIDI